MTHAKIDVMDPCDVEVSVPRERSGWELQEETMPESVAHDEAVQLLKTLLVSWARGRRDVQIARNLAVRWDEANPRIGVDPDVCVLSPAPPEGTDLRSVRTWMPGHSPPRLAIEVVSETNPRKDYVIAPDKYAASGTEELWIFDPLLAGPDRHGPVRLQVWRRTSDDRLERSYVGDGPAYSPALDAYLVVVDEGRKLRIAEDQGATRFWMTSEEATRAEKEAERVAKEAALAEKEAERTAKEAALAEKEAALAAREAERAAKEAALARIAELERKVGARGG